MHIKRLIPFLLVFALLLAMVPSAFALDTTKDTPTYDKLLIDQIYGGGGKSETPISNSFIELYNPNDGSVSLNGYTLVYGSDTLSLTGTIPAGGSYLIVGAAETTTDELLTYDLPDADQTCTWVINNKSYTIQLMKGDVSPEGLCFVPASDSGTSNALLLAACEVSGTLAVYELTDSGSSLSEDFFPDVTADAYYNAVQWAVRQGITKGTSATTFGPDDPCTRAQTVTFLWRAAGCPTPESDEMPFKDVVKGSYYYNAALWAVEHDITKGTSATTFSPDDTCNRAQFATLLWRSQGRPSADTTNPFKDVPAGAYYTDAVLWAVENKITEGTSATTFSPRNDCSRAETVTFLYCCLGA